MKKTVLPAHFCIILWIQYQYQMKPEHCLQKLFVFFNKALYVKGQGHSDPKSENRFRSITWVPFEPEPSIFMVL